MKKAIAIALIALVVLTAVFVVITSGNRLSYDEQLLFEALLIASKSFYNPSEVRILDVGDSYIDYRRSSTPCAYRCLTVHIQAKNRFSGTTSEYYTLYVGSIKGKELATYIKENTEKGEIEYVFFHSVEERDKAIYDYFKEEWDNCPNNEYPRSRFTDYEYYLRYVRNFYGHNYLVVKDYDKDVPSVKEENFGKIISNDTYIKVSEEGKYDIAKINKALNDYWNKRLGKS